MANRIGQVQKLGKQNRKRPDMSTNIITFLVSILFCHNPDNKNIGMTLNLSSTKNISYTTTADVHEEPADTIEKESPNNKKYKYSIAKFAVANYVQ